MNKQDILSLIQTQIDAGVISKNDLRVLTGESAVVEQADSVGGPMGNGPVGGPAPVAAATAPATETNHNKVANIFYGIGTIIVLAGIITFIIIHWNSLGIIGQIGVTLGISVVTYISGFLTRNAERGTLSEIMFLISGVLMPIGIFVLLDITRVNIDSGTLAVIAVIIGFMYGFASYATKRAVPILLSVFAFSWAYYMALDAFLNPAYELFQYATIVLGIAYIFVGHSFDNGDKLKQRVAHTMYTMGTLGILIAGAFIGDLWNFAQFLVIAGLCYVSTKLKSSGMLFISALFLMIQVFKVTFEYFSSSFSWPLMLILGGFIIIGIGYATFRVNSKYIR